MGSVGMESAFARLASGLTAVQKTVDGEGFAGAATVSAGGGGAPGQTVGGAGVRQGAGEEQGVGRCQRIQEPVLANARGRRRSLSGAGETPMIQSKEQRLRTGARKSRLPQGRPQLPNQILAQTIEGW